MLRRRSALSWVIPLLLSLQLGMLWIQGVQLHRQNQLIRDLRGDIQDLADSLDSSQDSSDAQDDTGVVPLRHPRPPRSRIQRAAVLDLQEEQQPDDARKDLEASRDSARKAVKEAREDQAKLSLQENARKAEEARKAQGATAAWQTWSLAALGLVVLALLARAYLRNR